VEAEQKLRKKLRPLVVTFKDSAIMTEQEILAQLPRIFADSWIGAGPEADLERKLALDDIDGLDSVSRVRLMLSVEDAFGVHMSPAEHGRLKTIGDLSISCARRSPERIR
jgi:acyl carrier protein